MLRPTVSFLLFFFVFRGVQMDSYLHGVCPDIRPQPEFNMNRMLGIWFVIEKTGSVSSCLAYNITKSGEPDEFKIEEISRHFLLGLVPLEHGVHSKGTLKIPDQAVPSRMTIKFSFSRSSTFTIFMTDYDTYAGIFKCRNTTFGNKQLAMILSRNKSLDKIYIDDIRAKLSSVEINPFKLSSIDQNDCPSDLNAGYNFNISDSILNPRPVVDVLKKVGNKLGGGIRCISRKTKKIYHKFVGSSEEDVKC